MSFNACVIPAFNTVDSNGKQLNYVNLAAVAATRVRKFLGIPVMLLTDAPVISNAFDDVIVAPKRNGSTRTMIAGERTVTYTWNNDVRVDAYDLCRTIGAKRLLMIDSDYMVNSDMLASWLNSDYPFLMFGSARDITGRNVYPDKTYLGSAVKQRWATAMCWQDSPEAKGVFDTAKMVRDNYEFYALMLGLPKYSFRNDLAFSVACHLMNIPSDTLAPLYNMPADSSLRDVRPNYNRDEIVYTYPPNKIALWSGDIHLINKNILYEPELLKKLMVNETVQV